MIKKIISIFLLLSMIYLSVGYYVMFEYGSYCAYRNFKMNNAQNGDLIAISKVAVAEDKSSYWAEQDEFSYDGHMYDMVREDAQYYYCLSDNFETNLHENLSDNIVQSAPMAICKATHLLLIIKDYISPATIKISTDLNSIKHPSFNIAHLLLPCLSLLIDPPEGI